MREVNVKTLKVSRRGLDSYWITLRWLGIRRIRKWLHYYITLARNKRAHLILLSHYLTCFRFVSARARGLCFVSVEVAYLKIIHQWNNWNWNGNKTTFERNNFVNCEQSQRNRAKNVVTGWNRRLTRWKLRGIDFLSALSFIFYSGSDFLS